MAQGLRVLVAIREDPGLNCNLHMTAYFNFQFWGIQYHLLTSAGTSQESTSCTDIHLGSILKSKRTYTSITTHHSRAAVCLAFRCSTP